VYPDVISATRSFRGVSYMGSGASKKAVVEEVKVVDPADLETKASDAIKAKRFDKALPMLQVGGPNPGPCGRAHAIQRRRTARNNNHSPPRAAWSYAGDSTVTHCVKCHAPSAARRTLTLDFGRVGDL
jgi:hypothetical protein